MKKILLALLFLGLAANLTYGNTYQVTMTGTVTSSNDPLLSVGNTFTNVFQYQSNSADGTFYSHNGTNPHGTTQELFGNILEMDGVHTAVYANMGFTGFDGFAYANHITVTGGVVSDFYWEVYWGETGTVYTLNSFSFRVFEPAQLAKGTVSFDTPISVASNVPESAATAGLLGFALIALAAFRRRSILS